MGGVGRAVADVASLGETRQMRTARQAEGNAGKEQEAEQKHQDAYLEELKQSL